MNKFGQFSIFGWTSFPHFCKKFFIVLKSYCIVITFFFQITMGPSYISIHFLLRWNGHHQVPQQDFRISNPFCTRLFSTMRICKLFALMALSFLFSFTLATALEELIYCSLPILLLHVTNDIFRPWITFTHNILPNWVICVKSDQSNNNNNKQN